LTTRITLLVAASMVFWLLVALAARIVFGSTTTAVYCGTALVLCLVPAIGTLALAWRARERSPEQVLLAVLGGTGVRMFFVLLAGLALFYGVPYFQEQAGFWYWVLIAYLFTLVVEVSLLLAGRPRTGAQG
jgi:hypothetical protein